MNGKQYEREGGPYQCIIGIEERESAMREGCEKRSEARVCVAVLAIIMDEGEAGGGGVNVAHGMHRIAAAY